MPMPPPPPPGPPPPGPPPPMMPAFNPKKSGGGDTRGALLQSIRSGTKLKKAVTVDKSAPVIPGKVSSNIAINNDVGRTKFNNSNSSNTNSQPVSNGLVLGGLFAGGMPKLRQTGLRTGVAPALNSGQSGPETRRLSPEARPEVRRPSPEPVRQSAVSNSANVTQLSEVLRRQLSGDIRNRGPPPQPPISRSSPAVDTPDSTPPPRFKPPNTPSSPDTPTPNKSSLHRSQPPQSLPTLHTNGSHAPSSAPATPRPAPSHGKPHVAPKPPGSAGSISAGNVGGVKPATPPKKLVVNGRGQVSRAQSMRVPRSPPVGVQGGGFQGTVNGKDFSTLRHPPTPSHFPPYHSTENLSRPHHSRNQTLPANILKSTAPPPPPLSAGGSTLSLSGRPSAPPPSRPPVPPPPSRTQGGVKAPLSPPPPPPGVPGGGFVVLGGGIAPPPPPHRAQKAPPPPALSGHTRAPPAIPVGGPPPPPVRNSSMRAAPGTIVSGVDFDTRFCNLFHPVTDLASPSRFVGFNKVYSNKSAANKQQAPLPPNSVHLGNKLWESSTC